MYFKDLPFFAVNNYWNCSTNVSRSRSVSYNKTLELGSHRYHTSSYVIRLYLCCNHNLKRDSALGELRFEINVRLLEFKKYI